MKKQITNSARSLVAIPSAIKYIITHPGTWGYILVPYVLNLILTLTLGIWLFNTINDQVGLLTGKLNNLPVLADILNVILDVVGFLLAVIVSIFALSAIGMAVNAPFNSLLSEKILRERGYNEIERKNIFEKILIELWRGIKFEVGKVAIFILLTIPLLLLNIIPVVGQFLFAACTFLLTGYLNTLDFYDPTLSYLDYGFKMKVSYLNKNLDSNLALILISGLVMNIPFVNILFAPVGYVVGSRGI